MTTKNTSTYATKNPNLRQPFSGFGHHNQQATDARMPCGTRTKTFNHSGQLEKFVTLGIANPVRKGEFERLRLIESRSAHSKNPRRAGGFFLVLSPFRFVKGQLGILEVKPSSDDS
jgi:hypothetical protein